MQKMLIIFGVLAASTIAAGAQYDPGRPSRYSSDGLYGTGSNPNSHAVDGYTRNGTYVPPHQQTNPNNTQRDNYGSSPNTNPYTGETGTRRPRY